MAAATVMAFSQIQAGRQAVKTAQYNAQLYEIDAVNAENEAVITQQKANLEISRFRQNIRSITGDTKVGYAASGVDISQGTPMDALEDIYQNAKIDEGLIQYNANIQKANLRNQAGRSRFQGAAAIQMGKYKKYASRLRAGATLLGGAEDAGMIGN
tara:strand:+ start:4108 stop:4575 length:468 start_codon:yes stop_codon:yes gene_type:complete